MEKSASDDGIVEQDRRTIPGTVLFYEVPDRYSEKERKREVMYE